jgi:hypothetical protein
MSLSLSECEKQYGIKLPLPIGRIGRYLEGMITPNTLLAERKEAVAIHVLRLISIELTDAQREKPRERDDRDFSTLCRAYREYLDHSGYKHTVSSNS